MGLPKLFSREVFIRLEGGETFATTMKYGCFYTKTEEFKVDWGASALTFQERATPTATYLVPPATMPPRNEVSEAALRVITHPYRAIVDRQRADT